MSTIDLHQPTVATLIDHQGGDDALGAAALATVNVEVRTFVFRVPVKSKRVYKELCISL